ncbi:RNA polymerase sigma factor [Microlunatus sp. Gsoil 973]|jgi:RNA polymerase sigma factor (sigma-70 family)|uniref:RNA polymerase sigma factor n=1 Tax=Microlunatus sp. Gsoil 973 TaxID=2672569 RepID=UPI0012B4AD92|nr:RNA polymerase sigma factor [Microlunatus sp. Gsoil 973]QGN33601.1 RNA polymerase subunit sigma-24 [Microlunatus sp. Gsoil 973]
MTERVTAADPGRQAVEAVWRVESSRIIGALTRYTGDFALAEDVAQEALAEALVSWPRDGIPDSPAGWLLSVGRRRAIDTFRRRSVRDEKYAVIASDAARSGQRTEAAPEELFDPDRIDDDRLALLFIACHPVLSKESQVALTLRTVAGLGTEQIARAFLVPVPTIQARITRAKKTLGAAGVPFGVPAAEDRAGRIGSVLNVIYLIFTEGSSASVGEEWIRVDLAAEAIRLARTLAQLVPEEPEAYGLLALCELTAARFPARTGPDGEPVLLADQDRRRWDRSAIRRGTAALAKESSFRKGLGPYGLQAAIAACHAVAVSVDDTDWDRIVVLYEALGRIAPSPIVELNRAVAVSMAHGPAAALPIVDDLVARDVLRGSQLLPSVRGELLIKLGRTAEARQELELAIRLTHNLRERGVLERKLADLP